MAKTNKGICPLHGFFSGHCKECKSASAKKYDSTSRDKRIQGFYTSARWKKVRAMHLKTNPICVKCGTVKKLLVDHIVEIKDGGAKYDLNNLQTLCISCHNIKTAKARKDRDGRE